MSGDLELPALDRDMSTASDEQLIRVVGLIDTLDRRGAVDELLEPVRDRLALLRPARISSARARPSITDRPVRQSSWSFTRRPRSNRISWVSAADAPLRSFGSSMGSEARICCSIWRCAARSSRTTDSQ